MNKKNIIPHQVKPVLRVNQGTSSLLAELSEENLSNTGIAAAVRQEGTNIQIMCSFDGDDAE
jgi:bacteriocin leader peptide (microcyclamide/patellamide family)